MEAFSYSILNFQEVDAVDQLIEHFRQQPLDPNTDGHKHSGMREKIC